MNEVPAIIPDNESVEMYEVREELLDPEWVEEKTGLPYTEY